MRKITSGHTLLVSSRIPRQAQEALKIQILCKECVEYLRIPGVEEL
jgi:hypothetical protein